MGALSLWLAWAAMSQLTFLHTDPAITLLVLDQRLFLEGILCPFYISQQEKMCGLVSMVVGKQPLAAPTSL